MPRTYLTVHWHGDRGASVLLLVQGHEVQAIDEDVTEEVAREVAAAYRLELEIRPGAFRKGLRALTGGKTA